jgi:hypothetical protein
VIGEDSADDPNNLSQLKKEFVTPHVELTI